MQLVQLLAECKVVSQFKISKPSEILLPKFCRADSFDNALILDYKCVSISNMINSHFLENLRIRTRSCPMENSSNNASP